MADDPLDALPRVNGKVKIPPSAKVDGDNIIYNGKVYDLETGDYIGTVGNVDEGKRSTARERLGLVEDAVKGGPGAVVAGGVQAAINDFLASDTAVRAGLIALGAALAIAGFAMIISGTKTAQLAASLIPAGKVLK